MTVGFIYILTNPSMPNLVKIGRTHRSATKRARELSSATGIPTPFEIAHSFRTQEPRAVEAKIHKRLAAYRTRNREFFSITVDRAVEIVKEYLVSVETMVVPGVSSQPRGNPDDIVFLCSACGARNESPVCARCGQRWDR